MLLHSVPSAETFCVVHAVFTSRIFLTENAGPFAEIMVQAASCTGNSYFNKEMEYQFHTVLALVSVNFKLDKLGGVSKVSWPGGLFLLSISAFC